MADVTDKIGSDGSPTRDFTTITLWEASLSAHSGDDVRGECYADSDFDESFTINDATPDSIVLTAADGEEHDGTANSGVRWQASTDRVICTSGAMPLVISWIEFDFNGNDSSQYDSMIHLASVTPNVHEIRNCLLHDYVGLSNAYGVYLAEPSRALNNIVYDNGKTHSKDRSVYGIVVASSSGDEGSIYNNTVYKIYSDNGASPCAGIAVNDNVVIKNAINNIVCGTTGTTSGAINDFVYAGANNTFDYNLSSDDSLPDGLHNVESKLASNQFVSTTDGSEDLHLKSGADAIGAGTDLGTTPSGVEIDIDGRDRDAEGDTWDIGADQYVVVATGIARPKINGSLAHGRVGLIA